MLWGVDLGGSKIEGVVLESADATKVVARERLATEAEGGYEHIIGQIDRLLARLSADSGSKPERIGFGTPGVLDPKTQTLKNSNTLCLNGKPLRRDLAAKLGRPISMTNDANCFTLAEARFGAGKNAASVFGVILGTGVGGGVFVNGQVLHGAQGIAGEWGHNVLEPDGVACYCGKRGCVERIISGPALETFYREKSGQATPLAEIYSRSKSGDSAAQATMARLAEYFGRAISVVINILDPEVIVLGGGVSNLDLLYSSGVESAKRCVFNNSLETKIIKNQLGDSAGVFGAALLSWRTE